MKILLRVKIFLLRLRQVLLAAFKQLYARIILSAFVRGIRLPGLERVRSRLPTEIQAALERRLLVREIKQQRYSFQFGPLWVRSLAQRLLVFVSRNRIWATLGLKVLAAALLVFVIGGLFIIVRGVLPVPERVPTREATIRLRENSNYRTEWLYTEPPFLQPAQNQRYNMVLNNFRNTSVIPVTRDEAPPGLYHFGIGDYPRRVQLLRGFIVSNHAPLLVSRQRDTKIDIVGKNRLQISYYLFPSPDGKKNRCRFRVRDENDSLLLNNEQLTPLLKTSSKGIVKTWRQRFTPDDINMSGELLEFTIDTDSPPSVLKFEMEHLNPANDVQQNTKTLLTNADQVVEDEQGRKLLRHDASNDVCVGAVANLGFEVSRVNPLPRRGLLFVLVDTLRAKTTEDATLMPNLAQFRKKALTFSQHRAQSNMTVPSVTSLMYSMYPRELSSIAFSYAPSQKRRDEFYNQHLPSLPSLMSQEGYRTAAFGNISLFTETIEGGIDFGFHDATLLEASEYEARHITEEVGDWLERYGDAPFFIYAHYHTMHGPYRPPFQFIDVLSYLKSPIGLSGLTSLYNALGRYWDTEFGVLQKRLADLGLLNKIDIVVTSDHGAQLEPQNYGQFLGVPENHIAATTDKGHSLTDEEVRVPMIVQLAAEPSLAGQEIKIPSAHIDVLPSLADLYLRETKTKPAAWHGLSWFGNNKTGVSSQLEPLIVSNNLAIRTSLYFDAMRYTAMLNYGGFFKDRPTKYIRQLAADRAMLYFDKFPYRRREKWYAQEMITTLDFQTRRENWLTQVDENELAELRKHYFMNSPSPRELSLTPLFEGELGVSLVFKVTGDFHNPAVFDLPDTVQMQEVRQGNLLTLKFFGHVKPNQNILILKNGSVLEAIQERVPYTWVTCGIGSSQFAANEIVNLLESASASGTRNASACTYQPIPKDVLLSQATGRSAIAIQNQLSWDVETQIEMSGAGAALREALRDWGYAK